MKNTISKIATTIAMLFICTSCGIVTVVPIGQESEYTGKKEFDSMLEAENDWQLVVDEITQRAVELTTVLEKGISTTECVSFEGTIKEFNTDTPKYYMVVSVDGYSGDEIRVQMDGPITGTAIRDVQTIKAFGSFTNQSEWSEYGKKLNEASKAKVTTVCGVDSNAEGKTVSVVGAATQSGGVVLVTAVSIIVKEN